MALFPLGILSAAAGGVAFESDYELIETQILGSDQASITFSSLGTYSSTYKHLQIRATIRDTRGITGPNSSFMRFNGDTGSNYSGHRLRGDASVESYAQTSSTSFIFADNPSNSDTSGNFSGAVTDILDPFSTTKYTTARTLNGYGNKIIGLYSGSWRDTSALTSISITGTSGDLAQFSRFSLYGIKG